MVKKSKNQNRNKKPKVAVHSITGCAGCQLEIYYVEDALLDLLDKIDLAAAPMIKGENYDGKVDICFVEGSVAYKDQIETLKKWRENAGLLISLGACAGEGGVQQQKNFVDAKKVESYVYGKKTNHLKIEKPTPITEYIDVDYCIKGCPADKQEIMHVIKQVLIGKTPKSYEKSVCHECKLRENHCLLDQDRDCYGPVTYGHCSIMCPDFNHPCTGCRGPISDSNFKAHIDLLKEKGYSEKLITQRLQKYSGLKMEKIMKGENK